MTAVQNHPRSTTYPVLSPTYCSHQLWTPLNLERLTINESKYHGYIQQNCAANPPHLNTLAKRVQKYGDDGFFLHKDIPIGQDYNRTALKRSDVRPWDELVSRPLMSQLVLDKETSLPFPSEHPYTSHISQFAVFPDTQKSPIIQQQEEDDKESIKRCVILKDIGVQTEDTSNHIKHRLDKSQAFQPQPRDPYTVSGKAYCNGLRIEVGTSQRMKRNDYIPGIYRWDVPKSKGHRRSVTYPAPRILYSSSDDQRRPRFLTPLTYEALQSVNHRMLTSTTYKREYPKRPTNAIKEAQLFKQHSLSDSRGKYFSAPKFTYTSESPLYSCLQTPANISRQASNKPVIMVDQSTQTDDEWDEDEFDEERPPSEADSYLKPSTAGSSCYPTSQSAMDDKELPQYSRTQVLRHFNQLYPDRVPDPREYSITSGRRHIINGYHAYYWH